MFYYLGFCIQTEMGRPGLTLNTCISDINTKFLPNLSRLRHRTARYRNYPKITNTM